MFSLGGYAISWKATLQPMVTLSTIEVDYMMATGVARETTWLKGLFSELSSSQDVTVIHCDSQGAIHLTKDQIGVKCQFIRDVVAQGDVFMKKFGNADNLTDMLTKPLQVAKFRHCLDLIGVSNT